ncbi:putative BPI/LBP family protein At1g04970 [Syzygium oleosum]|uniref:putative BPI/LBP family protein At1g04970 n=1 Tax=Syzygium oleosum TaxID=219896 RepID=UPI0011D1CBE2|nr:putative BPI/LBP family protein At1g04970 [Syzygium oleosum]
MCCSSQLKVSSFFFFFFFFVVSLLLSTASTQVRANEEGFISTLVSDKGLDFAKDLLIRRAVYSIIPLKLPQIEKYLKIPVVGRVDVVLWNISIDGVEIDSSYVKTGEEGIVLIASGATANLSMNWQYSYSTWLVPIPISDEGSASVQVKDMEVGLTLDLKDLGGFLKLSVLECGCYVKAISIKIDGGSSWLYQGVVGAFQGKIVSAVEEAIPRKITEEILKLDALLQDLPNKIPVGDVASLNVTFVSDPVLSNSSIDFKVNGLFTAEDEIVASNYPHRQQTTSVTCTGANEMIKISLHENVLKSASMVYFNADYMHWLVDKIPDQALLNTAGWKHIVPQLYKQYPNDDMDLNISVSAPPLTKVTNQGIGATIYADVIVDVLDAGEVIPVACVSLVIDTSGSAHILQNNLAGSIRVEHLSASLKWSNIGNLHMLLVQTVMSTVIKTVVVPYVNLHLMRGFPLPLPHGFALKNARIRYADSGILICSNVSYKTSVLI